MAFSSWEHSAKRHDIRVLRPSERPDSTPGIASDDRPATFFKSLVGSTGLVVALPCNPRSQTEVRSERQPYKTLSSSRHSCVSVTDGRAASAKARATESTTSSERT